MEISSERQINEKSTIPIQRILLWMGFLLGGIWPLYRLLFSSGWILDDEISHFLFSKAVMQWPEIVLDESARPGRNLIHSIIAPFGLKATRIYTLLLSMLAVFLCYRVALRLSIPHAWSIPFLLCFQPWYPELSYPILTQAPFMLVWIAAIYFVLIARCSIAAFLFGYLALIRHEGIFITALWGIWVICQPGGLLHHLFHRKNIRDLKQPLVSSIKLGMITIFPLLILNLIAYFIQGRIPFSVYLDSNPTDIYGNGSLFHYAAMMPGTVGSVILCLTLIGLYVLYKTKPRGWSLILILYPAYFVLHSIIFWRGSFASGGYYHFLMPMAPQFALLAALGLGKILTSRFSKAPWLAAAIIILVCYQGIHMGHYQHQNQDWTNITAGKAKYKQSIFAPIAQSSLLCQHIREATDLAISDPIIEEHYIHCAHVYFYYLTDQPDTAAFRAQRLAPLSAFPAGSYYIWDSQYADLEPRTSLQELEKNPNWVSVKTWFKSSSDKPSVILFRKTGDLPYEENLTPKGRNLSY